MPRICLNLPEAQYRQLERLTEALNRRAHELDPECQPGTIEGTAVTALQMGLDDLGKVWYATELKVHAQAPADGALACIHCGRPTHTIRVGDSAPECLRADCDRRAPIVPGPEHEDLYAIAMETGESPVWP